MKLKIISFTGVLLLMLIVYSCQSDESIEFKRYYSAGSIVYQSHCQNCHGAKGEGLSALIPPLTDTIYIKNNKNTLACAVKYGIKGNLTIAGRSFNSEMPASDLTPIEIAQVLTYVANSFGNKVRLISGDMIESDLAKCSH